MNLTATYVSHSHRLPWGKKALSMRESLEQSRNGNTGRPVNKRRSRWHRQPLSRCTDHKPCTRICRLEASSLGRHWSNQPQSCPNDMLHTSSNQVKNFVLVVYGVNPWIMVILYGEKYYMCKRFDTECEGRRDRIVVANIMRLGYKIHHRHHHHHHHHPGFVVRLLQYERRCIP